MSLSYSSLGILDLILHFMNVLDLISFIDTLLSYINPEFSKEIKISLNCSFILPFPVLGVYPSSIITSSKVK